VVSWGHKESIDVKYCCFFHLGHPDLIESCQNWLWCSHKYSKTEPWILNSDNNIIFSHISQGGASSSSSSSKQGKNLKGVSKKSIFASPETLSGRVSIEISQLSVELDLWGGGWRVGACRVLGAILWLVRVVIKTNAIYKRTNKYYCLQPKIKFRAGFCVFFKCFIMTSLITCC
jgi:hypothetical protein